MRYVSEGPIRITRATIDATWWRRQSGICTSVRDAECRGLALVVNPTTMAWRFAYKPRAIDPATGRRLATRTVSLGNPASLSIEAARRGEPLDGSGVDRC